MGNYSVEVFRDSVLAKAKSGQRISYLPKDGRVPSGQEYRVLGVQRLEVVHFNLETGWRTPAEDRRVIKAILALQEEGVQVVKISGDLDKDPGYPQGAVIALAGSVGDVCVDQRTGYLRDLHRRYILIQDLYLISNR